MPPGRLKSSSAEEKALIYWSPIMDGDSLTLIVVEESKLLIVNVFELFIIFMTNSNPLFNPEHTFRLGMA